MGRTVVRQANQRRGHRALNSLIVVVAAIIVLFALVGIVSAGSFLADKISGPSHSTTRNETKANKPAGNALAVQEIARANAQATAIVKAAQARRRSIVRAVTARANRQARSIVGAATARANRQARSIVAAARRRAASVTAAARTRSQSAPSTAAAPVSSGAAPSAGTTPPSTTFQSGSTAATGTSSSPGSTASGSTSYGSTEYGSTPSGSATGSGSSTTAGSGATSSAATPDLSSLPAGWHVVAYGASLSQGGGSAGSITVTNRGTRAYSGTAEVAYNGGGSASASFSGLAPGQTLTLPLSGEAYPGGGYQILVLDVH